MFWRPSSIWGWSFFISSIPLRLFLQPIQTNAISSLVAKKCYFHVLSISIAIAALNVDQSLFYIVWKRINIKIVLLSIPREGLADDGAFVDIEGLWEE